MMLYHGYKNANHGYWEAARKIRQIERGDASTIPIIALTANAFDDDIQNSLNAGMNEHLSKPINRKALLDTLVKYVLS